MLRTVHFFSRFFFNFRLAQRSWTKLRDSLVQCYQTVTWSRMSHRSHQINHSFSRHGCFLSWKGHPGRCLGAMMLVLRWTGFQVSSTHPYLEISFVLHCSSVGQHESLHSYLVRWMPSLCSLDWWWTLKGWGLKIWFKIRSQCHKALGLLLLSGVEDQKHSWLDDCLRCETPRTRIWIMWYILAPNQQCVSAVHQVDGHCLWQKKLCPSCLQMSHVYDLTAICHIVHSYTGA